MKSFSYLEPAALQEALELLKNNKGKIKVLAGGTDFLVQYKEGRYNPDMVMSLRGFSALQGITIGLAEIRVGAMTTIAQVEQSEVITRYLPALGLAAGMIGSVQVRNRATIGGNLCNAAPSADTAPILIAYGAKATIVGQTGARVIALENFFKGPGQTALLPDELLTEVTIPIPPGNSATSYLKKSRRQTMDIATVGVAVHVWVSPEINRIDNARIVLGAVGPYPFRARQAEGLLLHNLPGSELFKQAAQRAGEEARPINDVRASAWYRREVVQVLTEWALDDVFMERLGIKLRN